MKRECVRDIEPWFSDGLEVRDSAIHGQGLYATRLLQRGEIVLRLGGCLYSMSRRRSDLIMPSTTTPLCEEVILAEPADGCRDYSDYLNHSCDPNIGFHDAISLVAVRDIQAGSELVLDYTFCESDEAWNLKGPCRCGSICCRGSVTGADWRTVSATDTNFAYYSPFVKRRIVATRRRKGIDDEDRGE